MISRAYLKGLLEWWRNRLPGWLSGCAGLGPSLPGPPHRLPHTVAPGCSQGEEARGGSERTSKKTLSLITLSWKGHLIASTQFLWMSNSVQTHGKRTIQGHEYQEMGVIESPCYGDCCHLSVERSWVLSFHLWWEDGEEFNQRVTLSHCEDRMSWSKCAFRIEYRAGDHMASCWLLVGSKVC